MGQTRWKQWGMAPTINSGKVTPCAGARRSIQEKKQIEFLK
jgi:hypothetical protein